MSIPPTTAIHVQGLEKSFKQLHVLRGVHIDFERFQSMPIARPVVLWAHVLTSLAANLISLVLVALLMGFRTGANVLEWLALAGILMLFTLALTWLAVIPGLTAKSVDGGTDIWTALAWCGGILVVAYALATITYRRRIS